MRATIVVLALVLAAAAPRGGCNGNAPYDPCAGKACGQPCTICPPHAADCSETAVAKACDPHGRCVPEGPDLCAATGSPHPDCVGKACGDPCNPCGPERSCPTLIASACDRQGNCAGAVPWLCHDPCAGKRCGDACTVCPPDASGCHETMVVKACDAAGRCVPAPAVCGGS